MQIDGSTGQQILGEIRRLREEVQLMHEETAAALEEIQRLLRDVGTDVQDSSILPPL